MTKRIKSALKKAGMTVASILLAAVLFFSGAVSPVTVSAETHNITDLTVNIAQRVSWSAEQQAHEFTVDVDTTGFYTLTVTDHCQTGYIIIMAYEQETQTFCGIFVQEITSSYVTAEMYLCSGGQYSIAVGNTSENSQLLAGEVSVTLEKANYTPPEIPTGEAQTDGLSVTVEPLSSTKWLSFTTAAAGDYFLDLAGEDTNAYITVYKAGEVEPLYDLIQTEYYTSAYERATKDGVIITLEANAEYYFVVSNITMSNITTKLAIRKTNKDISTIKAGTYTQSIEWDIGIWNINNTTFSYRLDYTDGSFDIFTYDQACHIGYDLPYAEYMGSSVDANGNDVLVAGKKPIVTYYNDVELVTYTDIGSVTDWLISEGITATSFGEKKYVTFADYREHTKYWRVKVFQTGYYDFWSYEGTDFTECFEYFQWEVLDENNNIVQYDEQKDGWPLVYGKEYAWCLTYKFNDGVEQDVPFMILPFNQTPFPDTQPYTWYYDAVTYAAGRGTIKGYANGNFGVSDGIQRQDFLVMLARYDGVDLEDYSDSVSEFGDVASGSYYEAAVNWGYENGIVAGYDNGNFGVGDLITREQLVTFLYRYAQYKYVDVSVNSSTDVSMQSTYEDYNRISPFAKDAVIWAVENGVINGKTAATIEPQGKAQRCEVAAIMYNIFTNDVF